MSLSNFFESLAALGPWVVFPIYTVALSCFLHVGLLGLASGAMFGTFIGFLVFSFSLTLSAGLVFLAARHFAGVRKRLIKKINTSPKLGKIDDAVTEGGWKMVLLLRQTAVVPFTAMNYILGLSKIPFRSYILATWLGMLPGSLMLAYLGSVGGEMLFEDRHPKKSMLEWVFMFLGIAVTLGISIYATKRVRRILRET